MMAKKGSLVKSGTGMGFSLCVSIVDRRCTLTFSKLVIFNEERRAPSGFPFGRLVGRLCLAVLVVCLLRDLLPSFLDVPLMRFPILSATGCLLLLDPSNASRRENLVTQPAITE